MGERHISRHARDLEALRLVGAKKTGVNKVRSSSKVAAKEQRPPLTEEPEPIVAGSHNPVAFSNYLAAVIKIEPRGNEQSEKLEADFVQSVAKGTVDRALDKRAVSSLSYRELVGSINEGMALWAASFRLEVQDFCEGVELRQFGSSEFDPEMRIIRV